jgi:folylpolyglutamate synthase
MKVVKERAAELKASSFTIVEQPPQLASVKLGLAGKHQIENATLALHLARTFLERQAGMTFPESEPIPQVLARGLELTKWPGRCQQVEDPNRENTSWFLDGAHTVESLQCCFGWFASPGVGLLGSVESASKPFRVLIFNCTSGRSGDAFLSTALETIKSKLSALGSQETVEPFFDKVIFCTNITYTDGHFKGGTSLLPPLPVSVPTDDRRRPD